MMQQWWNARVIFGLLGGLSLLGFLILLPVPRADGHLIGSDGVAYYVYARSLVIDHDLDFTNEYAHFADALKDQGMTAAGRPANKYAIGPALLWMPFFLVAHLIAIGAYALGIGGAADGYGYLYQAAISIGSIIYGTLGFWLSYRCAQQMVTDRAALMAVVWLWLAGNVIYYMVFEPSMAHMVSLFSVALLLSIWFCRFWRVESPQIYEAMALGAAGGLVLLTRLQDGIFLLVPYGYLVVRFGAAWANGETRQAWHWLWCGVVAALSTILLFLPQLIAWQRIYGVWLALPYLEDHEGFSWGNPHIIEVLFSPFRGLFVWHPVLFIAFVGLLAIAQRDAWLAGIFVGVLLLNTYVVAAWWAWWQGDAFGGRMFLNATWIWVLGLAGAISWAWDRYRAGGMVMVIGIALVLWNALALVQYRLGFIPMSEPLTWEQITIDRFRMLGDLWGRVIGRGSD